MIISSCLMFFLLIYIITFTLLCLSDASTTLSPALLLPLPFFYSCTSFLVLPIIFRITYTFIQHLRFFDCIIYTYVFCFFLLCISCFSYIRFMFVLGHQTLGWGRSGVQWSLVNFFSFTSFSPYGRCISNCACVHTQIFGTFIACFPQALG